MGNVIDNIVNCQISIESPVENSASFATILLVGDAPKAAPGGLKPVASYGYLEDVLSAGWREDSTMYAAAKAAFTQNPKPDEIFILIRQEDEELTAAVNRALDVPGWYGLAVVDAKEGDYDTIAEKIENTEKIFGFRTAGKINPLINKARMRTFGIYSDNVNAHIAWMAKCFSMVPGSETWAYKTLNGVAASQLTNQEMRQLGEEKLNYYITCAGKGITRDGMMCAGEWIDVVRFRDWLKNQLQLKVFSLFVRYPKIPYTDAGIALVENQIESVLRSGQAIGGIAETEYDADDNPVYGYTVAVPKAAGLTSEQRAARKLTGVRFTARLSGAIHAVELIGNLVY